MSCQESKNSIHFFFRSNDDIALLGEPCDLHVKERSLPIRTTSASLLYQKCNWNTLVESSQLWGYLWRISNGGENSFSFLEDMVAIRSHTTRVSQHICVLRPILYTLMVSYVPLDRFCVSWGEELAWWPDPEVPIRYNPFKFSIYFLQGKFIHLILYCIEDEDVCAWAVECEGSSSQVPPCHLHYIAVLTLVEDRKDWTDGEVGVDDWGTIQWIKGNYVLSIVIKLGHISSLFRHASIYNTCLP